MQVATGIRTNHLQDMKTLGAIATVMKTNLTTNDALRQCDTLLAAVGFRIAFESVTRAVERGGVLLTSLPRSSEDCVSTLGFALQPDMSPWSRHKLG